MVSIYDVLKYENFMEVCKIVGCKIDLDWLKTMYERIPCGQGDAYLFSSADKQSLIYLDLFHSPTDQNEMITMGIRIPNEKAKALFHDVQELYQTAPVKSEEMKTGSDILKECITPSCYPKRIPTITHMEGKEVFEYMQQLICIS